jgi:acyl-CoA synthetase (AMP-forming)/AMP-acid ligase II
VIDTGDGLPLTIPALLRARAESRGAAVWLVCDDDVLTYADAEQRSAELARGLLAAGAGPGTHVAVLHPTGSEFAVAFLAAARIGAVAVPLSTFSTAAELRVLLRNADAALLLAAASYRSHDYAAALRGAVPELDLAAAPPLFAASVPALRRIAFAGPVAGSARDWSVSSLVASGRKVASGVLEAAEAAVGPGDRLAIVHTSGSTGDPKGVIHLHGALIRHLDNLNRIRRYATGEVLFSNSPFFWIAGLAYSLLGALVAGAKLVCSNAPRAAGVLDVLERERPTLVNGFAQSVAHLPRDPTFAGRDLSSIRRGNLYPILPDAVRPTHPDLRHAMLGMTETGSVCLASDDESDQPEHRRGSFGRPVPGFEAAVVDPASGEACGVGKLGELRLRGPFLTEGYFGRERHEVFEADGWFRTGDLFTVDGDGFYYFAGRRGDMIKTSGANVSPREVEAAIQDLTGLTAHVIGLEDAARGQVVAAAVRAPADGVVDVDELSEQLAGRLSTYKVPRRFLVLSDDAVPMLPTGKLDRRALEELFRAG